MRSLSSPSVTTACRYCGSSDVSRVISSFTVVRSEESRLDNLADPAAWGDIDENGPRSVARLMRQMQRETGGELGSEFDEMVDRMETGEMPEDLQGMRGDELQ